MTLSGKHAIVTGAASGIGLALATELAARGVNVVLADLHEGPLQDAVAAVGGMAVACDVTRQADVKRLIQTAEDRYGPVDIYFSNAGIFRRGDESAPDADWQLSWDLHVMAHVYAARELMPKMAARLSGYFMVTSSAAGVLAHIDSASYAVTKHAAVAFAEHLSIRWGGSGVRVSVLCPQQVRTAMTRGLEKTVSAVDGLMEPEELAACVMAAMEDGRFLILPHPEVAEHIRRKALDRERWLDGMRRLRARFAQAPAKAV